MGQFFNFFIYDENPKLEYLIGVSLSFCIYIFKKLNTLLYIVNSQYINVL